MKNGAIKSRIIVNYDEDSERANIAHFQLLYICMEKIYMKIFGKEFDKYFIDAYGYDELTVVNRFEPYYFEINGFSTSKIFEEEYYKQKENIGKDMVYLSNRFPIDDFYIINKEYMSENKIEISSKNIISLLFISEYELLGLTNWNIDLDNKNNK